MTHGEDPASRRGHAADGLGKTTLARAIKAGRLWRLGQGISAPPNWPVCIPSQPLQ